MFKKTTNILFTSDRGFREHAENKLLTGLKQEVKIVEFLHFGLS